MSETTDRRQMRKDESTRAANYLRNRHARMLADIAADLTVMNDHRNRAIT